MNNKAKFNTIALYAKTFSPAIVETLKLTYQQLASLSLNIYIERSTADMLNIVESNCLIVFNMQDTPVQKIDLMIVIGGDGSMLSASRFAVTKNIPLLGINLGNLGFLADIRPETIQSELTEVLKGKHTIEQRFLLNLETNSEACTALNEITLTACHGPQLIEFTVHIDNQLMYQQRSDGLIVATPTGSTAYALSGGGPIVAPNLDAIILVPMFPHTLNMRPIVISGESTINIKAVNTDDAYNKEAPGLRLCCDGHSNIEINNHQSIKITKHDTYLNLVHPEGYNYYESLRSKLHWAKKPSSKNF